MSMSEAGGKKPFRMCKSERCVRACVRGCVLVFVFVKFCFKNNSSTAGRISFEPGWEVPMVHERLCPTEVNRQIS